MKIASPSMYYGIIYFVVLCHLVAPKATWRQERMAGGTAVTGNKYPWVVYVLARYTEQPSKGTSGRGKEPLTTHTECTGSIIDIYGTVITAAHCVDDTIVEEKGSSSIRYKLNQVLVRMGSNVNFAADHSDSSRLAFVNPSMIRRHPWSYSVHRNKSSINIDLALMYLGFFHQSNPISCANDSTMRPIALSSPGAPNPTNGSIAGFGCQPVTAPNNSIIGYTGDLKSNLTEHSVKFHGRMDGSKARVIRYNSTVNNSSMFYGYAEFNKDAPVNSTTNVKYSGTCQGDSGGPYMEKESKEAVLRGIIVGQCECFGCDKEPCNSVFTPACFVDIDYGEIRRWIIKEVRIRYFDIHVPAKGPIPKACPTQDRLHG